ncbi:MAG: autotransporter outer membrane beta-barrel domain-containing protein [Endomicrobium sp.]|jgi:hypothetical protein|nr:autotransporter outer membrane beta-barrel domain-containing protein [Endomicrobium sp.]
MIKKHKIFKLLLILCLILKISSSSIRAQDIWLDDRVVDHSVLGNGIIAGDLFGSPPAIEVPRGNSVNLIGETGITVGIVAGASDRIGIPEDVEDNDLVIDIYMGGIVGTGLVGVVYGGVGLELGNNVKLNNLIIRRGDLTEAHGGRAIAGEVEGNTLQMIGGGTINYEAYGGRADGIGKVKDNRLEMIGGTISGNAYGGFAQQEKVIENHLLIQNGNIQRNAYGGRGQLDAITNELRISAGDINGADGAYGGYSDAGEARDNRLEVSGVGRIAHDAYGGYSEVGIAEGNILNMSGGTITNDAYGGYGYICAINNKLKMSNGDIQGDVCGGYSEGVVEGNEVLIQNASIQGLCIGGYGQTMANNNHVKILAGNFNNVVSGGMGRNGGAKGNMVEITDGVFNTDVRAAYSRTTVNENKVIINGGKFWGNIYGGISRDGGAIGNTVEISGSPIFSSTNTYIYGGKSDTAGTDTFTGNVFHVKTNNIEIAGMGGFETFKFYNPIKNGNPMIVCTTDKVSINNVEIDAEMNIDEDVDVGDKYIFITSFGGFNGFINKGVKVKQGLLSRYDASIFINNATDLGIVITREYINPRAEIITQSKAATLEIINEGLDLIVNEGIESAKEASMVAEGLVPFVAVKGSKSKLSRGAKIEVEGIELMGGVAKEINKEGNKITIGGFVEHGRKTSSLLGEIDFDKISAGLTGDYSGFGVLVKADMLNNSYVEGSARVGDSRVDFDTDNLDQEKAERVTYNYNTMYLGGHAGIGYIYKINNKLSIDMSSRLLFMYQQEKDLKLSSGDNLRFLSLQSGKIKLGANVDYKLPKQLLPYVGINYEYEILGKRVEAITIDIDLPAVDIDRGRFSGQAGIRKDIGNFNIDCSAMKYLGSKDGVDVMLKVKFYFGRNDITLTKIRHKAEKLVVKKVKRRVNDLKHPGKVSIDKRLKNIRKENKEKLKLKKELKTALKDKIKEEILLKKSNILK